MNCRTHGDISEDEMKYRNKVFKFLDEIKFVKKFILYWI